MVDPISIQDPIRKYQFKVQNEVDVLYRFPDGKWSSSFDKFLKLLKAQSLSLQELVIFTKMNKKQSRR